MAYVKREEQFYFPNGRIWIVMDSEFGVEIVGEEGINGDLVGMGTWQFASHESWNAWAAVCIESIKALSIKYERGEITEDEVTKGIYDLEHNLPDFITEDLVEQ